MRKALLIVGALSVLLCAVTAGIAAQTVDLPPGEYSFYRLRGIDRNGVALKIDAVPQFVYEIRTDGTTERTQGTWAVFRWSFMDSILSIGEERYLITWMSDTVLLALEASKNSLSGTYQFAEYSIFVVKRSAVLADDKE